MMPETTQQQRYLETIESSWIKVLPVLSLNIESSKLEVETGIEALSTQFSALYSKLLSFSQPHFHRISRDDFQVLESRCEAIRNHLSGADSDLSQTLDQLLTHVRLDHPETESCTDITQSTGSEIEEILVALQFQDRISQILGHVIQQIDSMVALVEEGRKRRIAGKEINLPEVKELLKRMDDGYSTPEERLNQSRQEVHVIANQDNNDLTFF